MVYYKMHIAKSITFLTYLWNQLEILMKNEIPFMITTKTTWNK